jgi:hypothetical protein
MSCYRWVRYKGEKLHSVGINDDGALHNPNGYPDEIVRVAVQGADERRAVKRSKAAKKAAETRQRRKQKLIWQIAKRMLAGKGIGARRNCAVCNRHLDDPASIRRGIGSECWQDVLSAIEQVKSAGQRAAE